MNPIYHTSHITDKTMIVFSIIFGFILAMFISVLVFLGTTGKDLKEIEQYKYICTELKNGQIITHEGHTYCKTKTDWYRIQ